MDKVKKRRRIAIGNKNGQETRRKIIDQSIECFNQLGVENVTLQQVARKLNISTGNLNYHFRNKQDLLRSTLDSLQDHLRTALVRPASSATPKAGCEYTIRAFKAIWDFRFLLTALPHLLRSDARLLQEYGRFRGWLMYTLETDLRYLAETGHLQRPIAPNNYLLLAENIWSQWLSWLRKTQIQGEPAASPSNLELYDAAVHHWSLIQLWLEPKFAKQMLKAFQQLLTAGDASLAAAQPAERPDISE
jgi:AcrR family transcriptional regulator